MEKGHDITDTEPRPEQINEMIDESTKDDFGDEQGIVGGDAFIDLNRSIPHRDEDNDCVDPKRQRGAGS